MGARAVVVEAAGPPEAMAWRDVDLPRPGAGELVVRHEAVGVNFLDVLMRAGRGGAAYPARLGVEGAGVVEAAGAGAGFAPGDRVVYAGGPPGAYADRRLLPAARAVALPPDIPSTDAAALFFKGLTAWYLATRTAPLAPGDVALVHAAAGGVGSLLARWLVHRGVRVVATVGSEGKRAAALATGAEAVLVLGRDDVAAAVKAASDGAGARAAFDSVGRDSWEASIDSLGPMGWLVSYGWASGEPQVDLTRLRNAGSLIVTRPTIAHYTAARADLEAGAAEVFALIRAGVLRFEQVETLPLSEVVAAHRRIESRSVAGPVVLVADAP